METGRQLEEYLSKGVETIVKGILRASFTNPGESMFMAKYIATSKKARAKRRAAELSGEHIPPFMIASITEQCNLHCKGCYARANHSCSDDCKDISEICNNAGDTKNVFLTAAEWGSVFTQAEDMGIEFILLAGGEPFVRQDILKEASRHPKVIFPVFTNGTMIDDEYMVLLEGNRNLLPIISIEGNKETTDARRGVGMYEQVTDTMKRLHKQGILFGASVTVTKENMPEVLDDDFINNMKSSGVKAVIYVEYVPIDSQTQELALDDAARAEMMSRLDMIREEIPEMVFIAFPGDEKSSGGCLAAGRGFFHINARGGAEPCPFSPYSDTNVRNIHLREVLKSPLFCALRENGSLLAEHVGGCVLFEQQEQVREILKSGIKSFVQRSCHNDCDDSSKDIGNRLSVENTLQAP